MVSTHGYVSACPPLGAEDTGGQVVYVLELSKRLAALGYDVDVWTRRFAEMPAIERVGEHVRILRVPCGGPEFVPKEYLYRHSDEWCERALHAIRRDGLVYEFIDSHYWDAGVISATLGLALGVPHVHTPHSLGLWKRDDMLRDWRGSREAFAQKYNFHERIAHESALYAGASLVIATSHRQLRLLVEGYDLPRLRVRMVPPGYDDERFHPALDEQRAGIRARLGWPDEPTVLAVGRLARNKGYDLLIEAFALVLRGCPRARLHLAVGGVERSSAEEALQGELVRRADTLGIASRVTFSGYVPDALLADTYRAADCFVLSSRYEPFGMTAVEAMACGTPAVVTCRGGMHEMIVHAEHALIADPHDAAELAGSISTVLGSRSLHERLSSRGRKIATSLFRWESITRALLDAVDGIAKGAERSGTYLLDAPEATPSSARMRPAR